MLCSFNSAPFLEIILQMKMIILTIFNGFTMYSLRLWETCKGVSGMIWILHIRRRLLNYKFLSVSLVLNTEPKDTHDSTNNLKFCLYPYSVKPDMDYLSKKVYSDYSR